VKTATKNQLCPKKEKLSLLAGRFILQEAKLRNTAEINWTNHQILENHKRRKLKVTTNTEEALRKGV